jgi:hypothetical protein
MLTIENIVGCHTVYICGHLKVICGSIEGFCLKLIYPPAFQADSSVVQLHSHMIKTQSLLFKHKHHTQ